MLLPLLASFCLAQIGSPKIEDAVVYEANLRACGGFAGVSKRLDALHELGVNVLWLMPIQPVGKIRSAGGLGSPYAIADFDKVNPEFGTPEEFRRLIEGAHRRNIAVVLDWVANHTAWDNPWLKNHPDWYTHDAKGEITIPAGTNWQDVADLNYDNRDLRKAMTASMKGWIDRYGVDGFRCDAADFVPFDFWKEAVSTLRKSQRRPLFMLAEGFRADHYAAGFDLTFGWNFYHKLRDIYKGAKASDLVSAVQAESRDIPPGARRLRFLTNHDESAWQGTILDFFKTDEGVKTAFTVTALYGGTPLIYTGQEVSWPKRIPIFENSTIDWNRDPQAVKAIAALFDLRRRHAALRTGTISDVSTDDAIVFVRKQGADEALVVANVRSRPINLRLGKAGQGAWRDGWTGKPATLEPNISLPAYGCKVFFR
ncbi:alpha-amylase family glycosyl hydrolase [Fimbriimonas ginsengisoli]|uniref:1,4-alpha-glucan branching enzyme n=1 Tax=Fimbriimonas ginsengisoli Gsoil 348 TaxID=661478 RepID=A0A068NS94_FIMGI|nr:alpha-amylase family glycosyl hydrolase [Fimbriimonas ginsengisoli]AIE85615.1 1,4-alpha-glucan branching enzyme [Fimbriimonas ginsengisoli Gsoil 348]